MEDLALVATVPVAKSKALLKSGPKKGKLRPGCRYKGKRILCTPEVASRLKGKVTKKRGGGRGPLMITAKTPQGAERQRVFQALLEARKNFKLAREGGDCGMMRHTAQKISSALQYMASLPAKPSKSNPGANPMVRNRRYIKEMDRVKREVITSCAGGGGGAPMVSPRSSSSAAANAAARAQYEEFMRSRGATPAPASEWEATARRAQMQENLRRVERLRSEGRAVNGLAGWRRASESECLKKNGRLKKGCKHAGNGKILKKVG